MTLRSDLGGLLGGAGIIDIDVDDAVRDEHMRYRAYRRIVTVAAAARSRAGDRALVAVLLREPAEMVAKSAVVDLVDRVAMKATTASEFRQWSAGILPELDRLRAEGHREFIHRRVRDWLCYLSVRAGELPTPEELADVTDWMQRTLADTSASPQLLALIAEYGRTRKIRNVAGNRSGHRGPRTGRVPRTG
ncbi:hypothetical protein [Streptomyces sp. NPDC050560]|uniref:hypothetical protein n=1 Tax=Streptomyces sp. NPDC050560 TaxID=3365630 RepID=UPI003787A344